MTSARRQQLTSGALTAEQGREKKRVPQSRVCRSQIRQAAFERAESLDRTKPITADKIEQEARQVLQSLKLEQEYLGWTMVAIASAFWRPLVMSIPYDRRLLLLPHCMRNIQKCRGQYDAVGLKCAGCGACNLHALSSMARRLGYRVLIAEGSPVVMQLILEGSVDAVLGVACLDSLEKAFKRVLAAGLPAMAVPLWSNTCRDSRSDEDWIRDMILTPYLPSQVNARTYIHLLRAAHDIFQPDELERLAPRRWTQVALAQMDGQPLGDLDPLAATELIAYDFILKGGKYLRPFITLAAFDAATGGHAAGSDGATHARNLPDYVRAVALAIETFHKASLVHDDIEDDDPYRYGQPALHRRFGISAAINVGDYLVGLGYRLVASQASHVNSEAIADILRLLTNAHTKLCEGQGAELVWREVPMENFTPSDAVRVYAMKTAPTFEAALLAGLRLAGPVDNVRPVLAKYCRHLGVAFQILNDLEDWEAQPHNKRTAARDALTLRPTLLRAMAFQKPQLGKAFKELVENSSPDDPVTIAQVRALYEQEGIFEAAHQLAAQYKQRAAEVAQEITIPTLRDLLAYLVGTVTPSIYSLQRR